MSVTSVQQRIGDKLSALGFPYFYDESLYTASGVAGAKRTDELSKLVMQLRDGVVFVEDIAIRALEPSERQFLRQPSTIGDDVTKRARSLLQKLLVPYGQLLLDHPLVDRMTLAALLTKASKPTSSADEMVAIAVGLQLTNCFMDLAVQCSTQFGTSTLESDVSAPIFAEINAAHKQFVDDQTPQGSASQNHRNQLVTTLERISTYSGASATSSTGEAGKSSSSIGDEGEARALLDVLAEFLESMKSPKPLDLGEALDATIRLLSAVQSNMISGSDSGGGGVAQAQTVTQSPQQPRGLPKGSALETAATENLNRRVADLLNSVPLPVPYESTVQDPVLRDAVRVMRLLFTNDLAALQNYGSQMIASLQAFTATCKTDARLGKIGS